MNKRLYPTVKELREAAKFEWNGYALVNPGEVVTGDLRRLSFFRRLIRAYQVLRHGT